MRRRVIDAEVELLLTFHNSLLDLLIQSSTLNFQSVFLANSKGVVMLKHRFVRHAVATVFVFTIGIGSTLSSSTTYAVAGALTSGTAMSSHPAPSHMGLRNSCGTQNLRTGPGTNFSRNGVVRANAEIAELGYSGAWSKIRVVRDGRVGWIRSICVG